MKNPGFLFRLCHLPAVKLWTNHLTPWSLSVFMCKMGIKICISLGFAKIKGDDICESLWEKGPGGKKALFG